MSTRKTLVSAARTAILTLGLAGTMVSEATPLPTADTLLRFALVPDAPLRDGEASMLHVEVENRGPGTAPSTLALFDYFLFGGPGAQVWIDASVQTPPCEFFTLDVSPGAGAGGIFVYLYFPPIAPGTTTTCTLSIAPVPDATGAYTVTAEIYPINFDNRPAYLDPIASNNTAATTVSLPGHGFHPSPALIPSTTAAGAWLLILGIGLAGVVVQRRSPS